MARARRFRWAPIRSRTHSFTSPAGKNSSTRCRTSTSACRSANPPRSGPEVLDTFRSTRGLPRCSAPIIWSGSRRAAPVRSQIQAMRSCSSTGSSGGSWSIRRTSAWSSRRWLAFSRGTRFPVLARLHSAASSPLAWPRQESTRSSRSGSRRLSGATAPIPCATSNISPWVWPISSPGTSRFRLPGPCGSRSSTQPRRGAWSWSESPSNSPNCSAGDTRIGNGEGLLLKAARRECAKSRITRPVPRWRTISI